MSLNLDIMFFPSLGANKILVAIQLLYVILIGAERQPHTHSGSRDVKQGVCNDRYPNYPLIPHIRNLPINEYKVELLLRKFPEIERAHIYLCTTGFGDRASPVESSPGARSG